MNRFSDIYAPIVGRILVGGYFLWSGIGVALDFPGENPFLIAFMFIEVLGGIALVVGYKTRSAALVLALFTLLAGFFDRAFLFKDLAIMGGLLYISAFGSGAWDPTWPYSTRHKK